jgi:hypothetical protein
MNTLKDMWNNPAKYSKFWVALVTAGVAIITQQFGADSTIVQDVVLILGALGVVAIPNAEAK